MFWENIKELGAGVVYFTLCLIGTIVILKLLSLLSNSIYKGLANAFTVIGLGIIAVILVNLYYALFVKSKK